MKRFKMVEHLHEFLDIDSHVRRECEDYKQPSEAVESLRVVNDQSKRRVALWSVNQK